MNDFHIWSDKMNQSSGFNNQTARGNVYDRLIMDSMVRKKNTDFLLYSQNLKPKNKDQKLDHKIEEILMKRHQESQARLTALKLKHQADEMREMRPVPMINSVSKKIVEMSERLNNEEVKAQDGSANKLQEILSNSRFSRKMHQEQEGILSDRSYTSSRAGPKHTEISLKDLEKEAIKYGQSQPNLEISAKNFGFFSHKNELSSQIENSSDPQKMHNDNENAVKFFNDTKQNYLTIRNDPKSIPSLKLKSPRRAETAPTSRDPTSRVNSKRQNQDVTSLSIEQLRKAVKARPKVLEHEEPPDLLDMDVMERGKF